MSPGAAAQRAVRVLPSVALAALLSALACSGLLKVFRPADALPALAGAVLLAAAVAAVPPLAGRRLPVPVAAAAHLAAAFAFTMVVLPAGPGAVVQGLGSAWSRVLSTALPAAPTPGQLLVVPVLAWATAALCCELAVRSTSPLLPAVPAVAALAATRMLAASAESPGLLAAATGLAAAGVGLAVLRSGMAPDPEPGPGGDGPDELSRATGAGLASRRTLVALPVLLACVVAALLVAPALPWAEARDPFDPRTLRHVPPVQPATINPLARIGAYLAQPDVELFQLRTTVESGPADVAVYPRMAVLSDYFLGQWSTGPGTDAAMGGRFEAAGSQLPAAGPERTAPTAVVRQTLRFAPSRQDRARPAYEEAWVPAADRARSVTGTAALFDPVLGVLALPEGAPPAELSVTSAVAYTGGDGLAAAGFDRSAATERFSRPVAGLPPEFLTTATGATAGAGPSDFERVTALVSFFRTQFSANRSIAGGGQDVALLLAFLRNRVGTSSEQFAAAFALLARQLGIPVRVAVGFQPVTGATTKVVTAGDILVWPEVAMAGFGWVPFDVTPPDGSTPREKQPEVPVASAAAVARKVETGQIAPSGGPAAGPAASRSRDGSSPARALLTAGLATAALVLVVAAAGLVVVALKRRRRLTRRRAPSPTGQVMGAWAEAVDRLRERGLPSPATLTSREVAASAGEALGEEPARPLRPLGTLVNLALYTAPGTLPADAGDRAWVHLDELDAALRPGTSAGTRLRLAVDPRPLLRRPEGAGRP